MQLLKASVWKLQQSQAKVGDCLVAWMNLFLRCCAQTRSQRANTCSCSCLVKYLTKQHSHSSNMGYKKKKKQNSYVSTHLTLPWGNGVAINLCVYVYCKVCHTGYFHTHYTYTNSTYHLTRAITVPWVWTWLSSNLILLGSICDAVGKGPVKGEDSAWCFESTLIQWNASWACHL